MNQYWLKRQPQSWFPISNQTNKSPECTHKFLTRPNSKKIGAGFCWTGFELMTSSYVDTYLQHATANATTWVRHAAARVRELYTKTEHNDELDKDVLVARTETGAGHAKGRIGQVADVAGSAQDVQSGKSSRNCENCFRSCEWYAIIKKYIMKNCVHRTPLSQG